MLNAMSIPERRTTPETDLAGKGKKPKQALALKDKRPTRAKVAKTGRQGRDGTERIDHLLKRCMDEGGAAVRAKTKARNLVERTLTLTHELMECVRSDTRARKKLLKALRRAGIRKTKKTTSLFIRVVKMVFGVELAAASVNRYASVLQAARQRKVAPTGFIEFLRAEGGLTKCAALAKGDADRGSDKGNAVPEEGDERDGVGRSVRRKAAAKEDQDRGSGAGGPGKHKAVAGQDDDANPRARAKQVEQLVKARRRKAAVLRIKSQVQFDEPGLYEVLVDVRKDMSCRYLGHRKSPVANAYSILQPG
jgi:hypothetical protein